MELKFRKLVADAVTPVYGSDGAAAFDLSATEDHDIPPDGFHSFHTGLSFEVPEGYVLLVYSRSGMGFKSQVRLCNCVGVVDSDFRGEVLVGLVNDSPCTVSVKKGNRIAQAMLVKIPHCELVEVQALSDSARGTSGYGSTGGWL